MDKGSANHYYHARVKDCGICPFKKDCCANKRRQSLMFSVYRRYHKLMQERVENKEGKSMKSRRMATVEPVFGSLLNYYGMRRSNAKGRQAAHKFMLMTACAYNLQKLLTHIPHPKNKVQSLPVQQLTVLYFILFCVVQQPGVFYITRMLGLLYIIAVAVAKVNRSNEGSGFWLRIASIIVGKFFYKL
jgi:hypothetical protein